MLFQLLTLVPLAPKVFWCICSEQGEAQCLFRRGVRTWSMHHCNCAHCQGWLKLLKHSRRRWTNHREGHLDDQEHDCHDTKGLICRRGMSSLERWASACLPVFLSLWRPWAVTGYGWACRLGKGREWAAVCWKVACAQRQEGVGEICFRLDTMFHDCSFGIRLVYCVDDMPFFSRKEWDPNMLPAWYTGWLLERHFGSCSPTGDPSRCSSLSPCICFPLSCGFTVLILGFCWIGCARSLREVSVVNGRQSDMLVFIFLGIWCFFSCMSSFFVVTVVCGYVSAPFLVVVLCRWLAGSSWAISQCTQERWWMDQLSISVWTYCCWRFCFSLGNGNSSNYICTPSNTELEAGLKILQEETLMHQTNITDSATQ